jgi:hypothetical protein
MSTPMLHKKDEENLTKWLWALRKLNHRLVRQVCIKLKGALMCFFNYSLLQFASGTAPPLVNKGKQYVTRC